MSACGIFLRKLVCIAIVTIQSLMGIATLPVYDSPALAPAETTKPVESTKPEETKPEVAPVQTRSVYIYAYEEGKYDEPVQKIWVGKLEQGTTVDKETVMAKLTAAYPEKDYTNDQIFYNDGGMNNIKQGKYATPWNFDTMKVGAGQLNLHTIVYKVAPVYIQVFKNGDTSKATDSIYVGKYKENHKIPEADVKAAFAAKNTDNKLENFGLYYAQGNWNRFKDGLDATAWDFNGRTLLGYTNLFTMAYEKQTVKYYLSDELRTKGTKYAYASATGYKGLALENTAEDPVKEGYTFKYWAKEGQNTNYFTSGQKVNGWTNLVAKFKANEYKLKLTGNGGSYKADGKNQQIFETTVTYDSAYEIPEFTMNGYHFVGWSTDYHGENMVELGDVWNIAHDVELHAVWAPNVGVMNLYANGGVFEDGETVKTVEFKVGDQYSKVIVNPTREGYRLAGWAYGTDKGASGNVGLSWNIGAKDKINLAAIWEPIETEEE